MRISRENTRACVWCVVGAFEKRRISNDFFSTFPPSLWNFTRSCTRARLLYRSLLPLSLSFFLPVSCTLQYCAIALIISACKAFCSFYFFPLVSRVRLLTIGLCLRRSCIFFFFSSKLYCVFFFLISFCFPFLFPLSYAPLFRRKQFAIGHARENARRTSGEARRTSDNTIYVYLPFLHVLPRLFSRVGPFDAICRYCKRKPEGQENALRKLVFRALYIYIYIYFPWL